MANRALYEQEIGPIGDAATIYFQRFMVSNKERCWLLPRVETWRDLSNEQINYVMTYLPYFKKEIEKVHERQNDQIPFNYGT